MDGVLFECFETLFFNISYGCYAIIVIRNKEIGNGTEIGKS